VRQRFTPKALAILDANSGAQLNVVPTGGFPIQMEFGALGSSLIVVRQITTTTPNVQPVPASRSDIKHNHDVTIWDLATMTPGPRWTVAENAIAISGSGQRIAAADENKIRVWDATNGQQIAEMSEPLEPNWRLPMAFDSAHQRLAIHLPKELHIWNIATGERVRTIASAPGLRGSMYFRSVGNSLFAMSDRAVINNDNKSQQRAITSWNLATGARELEIPTHVSPIFAIGPDGRHLAYITSQNIEIFDAGTGQHQATFRGHVGPVFCIAFSPDSRRLYSSGLDNTLRTWNLEPWRD